MRSLLILSAGEAAPRDSGADALVLDAAAGLGGPSVYLRFGGFDAAGLSAAAALRPRGFALTAAGASDVQRLGARLAVEEALLGLEEGTFRILAFATESARAIFGLPSYGDASARLDGLVWSAAPLAQALRASPARRNAPESPLQLARNLTLMAARAAGVRAWDAPYPAEDLAGLRAEALAARADGFDGKAATDARQVAVINEVFADL